MSNVNITPQPGYVIVNRQPIKEEASGEIERDSGIVLQASTAERLKKQATHQEWEVLAVSSVSEFKTGDTLVTSKKTQALPIDIGDNEFGIMAEDEVVAFFN